MATAMIDQTQILDLIKQQDPVARVNFAIGALWTQIEQIGDELDPMTDNIDDMTVNIRILSPIWAMSLIY